MMSRKRLLLTLAVVLSASGIETVSADTKRKTSAGCKVAADGHGDPATPVKSGYVKVGRAKLYYEELGEGYPLVLIHGGGIDLRMWDQQFEVFAEHFRVIRYDVRGHGRSRCGREDFSDQEDLRGLLKQLGIERAHMVGLSLGGFIAIDFALQYPQMVSALIPVSPGLSGYPNDSEQVRAHRAELGAAFGDGDLEGAIEIALRAWIDGPHREPAEVDPAVRERVRVMAREGIGRFVSRAGLQGLDPPAFERLAEIRVPTLCIIGDIDMPDLRAIMDAIVSNVPGAEKVVVPGVAHMVNMEKPREFNRIVLDFLSRHCRR
ncbi:MAG: alpha/beta hydrolase [Phycisphaerales bacterium]|nr:MAG: alpha/beta hydrolase [Phycisphaerales bacterium]